MSLEMTSRQRIKSVIEGRIPDRVPILDNPWQATILRWQKEGLPPDANPKEFLGMDKRIRLRPDMSPRFESKVLESTEDYEIRTTEWGATLKNFKKAASTPEFLDYYITDADIWKKVKTRLTPDPDRIDWDFLKANYKHWRDQGYWIEVRMWFGFDVTHSWIVGTERLLMAMMLEPEWVKDIFETQLQLNLETLQMLLDEGYEFDCVHWPDDMGYKENQFFSLDTYRSMLKPFHQRAVQWAKNRGIKTHLHSCGDIRPFIDDIIDIGVDILNPLEVKAGMNPQIIKEKYGDKLTLHGGINTLLYRDNEMLTKEVERLLPILKRNGRYIFASDHSIPSDISLSEYQRLIELVKQKGSYN